MKNLAMLMPNLYSCVICQLYLINVESKDEQDIPFHGINIKMKTSKFVKLMITQISLISVCQEIDSEKWWPYQFCQTMINMKLLRRNLGHVDMQRVSLFFDLLTVIP